MGERRAVVLDPNALAIARAREERKTGGQVQVRARRQSGRVRRKRITLELDERIRDVIREVAAEQGTSPAGVVNLFVADALGRYRSGELDFSEHVRTARNTRYEWVVELGEFFDE